MAQTYRQQFLAVLRRNEADMTVLFQDVADTARAALLMSTGQQDTPVPPNRAAEVKRRIGQATLAVFLDLERLAAYDELPTGEALPLSPYARVVHRHATTAVTVAVDRQAALMRRSLRDAPDVLARFQRATLDPFAYAHQVQEQAGLERFRPFLVRYDPYHRFVHADGYRLSDRVWQNGTAARLRVDLITDDGIVSGRSALNMAQELERFLLPGQQGERTNKPYGRDVSYPAMRLARTEITAAGSRAGLASASMNPFVEAYTVHLSRAHPKPDICDEVAAGGPYALDDLAHLPPLHPH